MPFYTLESQPPYSCSLVRRPPSWIVGQWGCKDYNYELFGSLWLMDM